MKADEGKTPDQFTKILLSVVTGLIGAGVLGMWNLSHTVARLEERIAYSISSSDKLFVQISADLRTLDSRVSAIERRPYATTQPAPSPPQHDDTRQPPVALPPNRYDDRRR